MKLMWAPEKSQSAKSPSERTEAPLPDGSVTKTLALRLSHCSVEFVPCSQPQNLTNITNSP